MLEKKMKVDLQTGPGHTLSLMMGNTISGVSPLPLVAPDNYLPGWTLVHGFLLTQHAIVYYSCCNKFPPSTMEGLVSLFDSHMANNLQYAVGLNSSLLGGCH